MFALKPFTHEGRSLVQDEAFVTTPVQAAALLRTGNADLIENRRPTHNRELVAGRPAGSRRSRKTATGSRQRGGYRRRDMTTNDPDQG